MTPASSSDVPQPEVPSLAQVRAQRDEAQGELATLRDRLELIKLGVYAGFWDLDLQDDRLEVDVQRRDWLGYPAGGAGPDDWLSLVSQTIVGYCAIGWWIIYVALRRSFRSSSVLRRLMAGVAG